MAKNNLCPNMQIDELMIFNKELSQAEVTSLNNGNFFCNGIESKSSSVCTNGY
jgi:hypothetical protein